MHHGQHERNSRFWILTSTVSVALVVFGLLCYGLLQQYWLMPRRAVANVGDSEIPLSILQQHTRYRRVQLLNEYFTYYELLQYTGERRDQLQALIDQIDEQLNEPTVLAAQALEELIVMELVRTEAAELGITVGKDDIETSINAYFGYADHLEPTTPVSVVTPSDDDAAANLSRTPTPYTESAYNETYAAHLETLNDNTGMSEAAFRGMFEHRLLQDKLRFAMTTELEIIEEEQVHLRHILLSLDDLETAHIVLTRAAEGEDFAVLAAEFSTDYSNAENGGDLGWVLRGQMVPVFEEVVFSSETGVIPELVATQFGLHVVEILEKDIAPLPDNVLMLRRRQAFDEWISEQLTDERIEILDWWTEFAPSEPTMQDFYDRLRAE